MPNPELLLSLVDPDDVVGAKSIISTLKYQLKKVENGNKSKRAEIQLLLKKQGEIIENLEKEKFEVQQSVHLLQSESLAIGDQKCSNQLKRLLKIQDRYRLEINAAKQVLKMLNKQLFAAHQSLLHFQKEIDFSNDKYKVIKHQKKIELLESRLNNAIIKFDHFRKRNSIFREQIDVMLNVRSVFCQNYTSIKQMIMQAKQSAKEIIYSSSLSYKTREEMKYRIGVLEERAKFDRKRVCDEMKALKRVLEHDKQLCSFLRHRDKKRKSAARERFKNNPLKDIELLKEEVQICGNIFKEISAVASTIDTATVIAKFQKVEDDNFTKFGIINEMNNEIENLRNNIQCLYINISNEEKKLTFHQKKAAYEKGNIEGMLKMLEHDVENLQRSASENSTILENTKDFIRKLFEKTNKFYSPEPELFNNDDVINVDAQQFIEILEIRIMELLYCYQYLLYKLRKDEGNDMLSSEITAAPATHPHLVEDGIIPPQIEDFIMNIEGAHDIQEQIYSEEKLTGLANTSISRRLEEE